MPWAPDTPYYFEGILWKRKFRLKNGGEIHWGGRRWRRLLLSREDMQRLFGGRETDNSANKKLKGLSKNDSDKELIHEAISAIYDLAEAQGIKPPNLREIIKPVQQWLSKHRGATAPGLWIQEFAADNRYNSRRGKLGVRASLRPVSKLQI
jgi:hypothetical protein